MNPQRRPSKPLAGRSRRKKPKPDRRDFHVLVERDEAGWFVASVPELRGCHTQARTLDLVLERIREAIAACIDANDDTPVSEFVGITRVSVDA